jgi:hypothetical protein
MRVQRDPTHLLVVNVPIHLDRDASFDYDPVHDALNVVMSVSRLAVDGVACGDVNVCLYEVRP